MAGCFGMYCIAVTDLFGFDDCFAWCLLDSVCVKVWFYCGCGLSYLRLVFLCLLFVCLLYCLVLFLFPDVCNLVVFV